MKTAKRYRFNVIVTQMVILPIILTIALFILGFFPNTIFKLLDPFNDSGRLINFLIAVFISLLFGTAVGYIFAKKSKNKPDSVKSKYIPVFGALLYALFFSILVIVFAKDNYNSAWWMVNGLKNPTFAVFDLILFFFGFPYLIIPAELMANLGFLFGIFLEDLSLQRTNRNKEQRNLTLVSATLVFVVVFVVSFANKDLISYGAIELTYGKSTMNKELTEFELMNIAPFKEDNGLAKLEKPSSLQFTDMDTMPRLDGATAAYPVYAAFVESVYTGLKDYYEEHEYDTDKDSYAAFVTSDLYPYNIVKCSKTGTAYERLMSGDTDIIFVAEPSKMDIERVQSNGDDFILTPIGSEAFVFFTNVKNPVESLTISQIQDIYLGKITSWKEVGGQNKTILPFQRPENSGSQTVMQNKVMKNEKMIEPTQVTFAGGMGEIINEVAGYKNAKNAIGYSFMYYSSQMIKNNQIKYIAINGIKPTPETVRNKTYPFTVPVYAVTLKSNTNENVKKMLDWIVSEEGQSLVEKTGYIPVK